MKSIASTTTPTREALVELLMRSDRLGDELNLAAAEIAELALNPLISKCSDDLPEETRKLIQDQVQVVLERITAIDKPRGFLQLLITLHLHGMIKNR